MSAVVNFTWSM